MTGEKTIGLVKTSRKDLQQSQRHCFGLLQHLEESIGRNSNATRPFQSHYTRGSRTFPENSKFSEHLPGTEFAEKHFHRCVRNGLKNPDAAGNDCVCRPSRFVLSNDNLAWRVSVLGCMCNQARAFFGRQCGKWHYRRQKF